MTITGVRKTAATWTMTAEELARVWADHFGYTTTRADAGWIRDPSGRPVCQGWRAFADKLTYRRFIKVGRGIDWRLAGEAPRITRWTPTA